METLRNKICPCTSLYIYDFPCSSTLAVIAQLQIRNDPISTWKRYAWPDTFLRFMEVGRSGSDEITSPPAPVKSWCSIWCFWKCGLESVEGRARWRSGASGAERWPASSQIRAGAFSVMRPIPNRRISPWCRCAMIVSRPRRPRPWRQPAVWPSQTPLNHI